MKSLRVRLFLLFSALAACASTPADAQLFQRRRALPDEQPPSALLVLLPTGARRLAALRSMGDSLHSSVLRYDLERIRTKMMEDFRDNYTYGPVYFFMDTSVAALRAGDVRRAFLVDATGQPVPESELEVLDTNYLVAFYGYRSRDLRAGGSGGDMINGDTEAMIQQLVLLDYNLAQLQRPLPRTVSNRYAGMKTKERRPRYYYRYVSKYFDLQYRASAARASLVLSNFYGTQRAAAPAAASAVPPAAVAQ